MPKKRQNGTGSAAHSRTELKKKKKTRQNIVYHALAVRHVAAGRRPGSALSLPIKDVQESCIRTTVVSEDMTIM